MKREEGCGKGESDVRHRGVEAQRVRRDQGGSQRFEELEVEVEKDTMMEIIDGWIINVVQ